jgi:hypothetical protein
MSGSQQRPGAALATPRGISFRPLPKRNGQGPSRPSPYGGAQRGRARFSALNFQIAQDFAYKFFVPKDVGRLSAVMD